MRENIGLYRGKRIDNGKWVYGYYEPPVEFDGHKFGMTISYIGNHGWLEDAEIDPNTVGEYTGLTDKNGKKIFEGDICDFSILDIDHTTVKISIKHGAVGFAPVNYAEVAPEDRRWRSFWRDDEETLWNTGYFCVIGNIHDNPELLEAADG